MHPRIAAACAALALACSSSTSNVAPDGGTTTPDGGVVPDADDPAPDGNAPTDDSLPPDLDGGLDDDAPDASLGPPALIAITPAPGTAAWLHEPVRFHFDHPLRATSVAAASVTATIAGAPVSTTIALETPTTLAVTIDPAARGIGALAVDITGELRGSDGSPAQGALSASYALAPWSGVAVDRGVAAEPPSLAVDSHGGVIAAWTVGAASARRVVVGRLTGGSWQALGDPLGRNASSVAIALDAAGIAVVAWIDGGVAQVARWDGTAWRPFASPGRGTTLALAAAPGGDPVIAVLGATAAVHSLTAGAWQPVGEDVAIPRSIVGAPALAVGDSVALGWIDSGGQLRVYRSGTTWTEIAPIAVVAPSNGTPHLSLAARGAQIAVAWDAWAGSLGVVAAQVTGSAKTWTALGHLLDVDPASDASGPAIAIDAAGAPIVAWTERIDASQRGIVARFTDRWTIVGGATFLADETAAPSPVRMALADAQTPVVGWTAAGAVSVQRLNGPAVPGFGRAARASIAGCGISASTPPALLSQTGCFTLGGNLPTPHAGLVRYGVVNELWSDEAHKRRWIGLPDGAPAMTVSTTGAWTAPPGTVMVKEFSLEMTPGDPTSRRPIETRLLVRDPQLGWQGFSYRWRTDGSDATIQPDEAQTISWSLATGRAVPHVYPSRSHCLSCHENSYGPLLGVRSAQLQRWADYDGVIADQITTLNHLGIGPAATDAPFPAAHDPSETVERRMRGYMASNCAHCHNPNHIAIKDLRFTTPLASTRLCEAVVPGAPSQSVVYQKVSSRPGMPALGTAVVDPFAVDLIGAWITQLTSCP